MVSHEVIFDSYYMVVRIMRCSNLLRCDLRALRNPTTTFTFDTEDYKNIEGDKYRIFMDYVQVLKNASTNSDERVLRDGTRE